MAVQPGHITGEGGKIQGVPCVRAFRFVGKGIPAEGVCSDTQGVPIRLAGNDDFNGHISTYGYTPAYLPGATFTFQGATRLNNGVEAFVRVDRTVIRWNTEQAKLIECEMSVSPANDSATSLLALGAVTPTGTNIPNPNSPVRLGMNLNNSSYDNVRIMELTLSCGNPRYVDSSTDGHTLTEAGNKDASFRCYTYIADPSVLPADNAIVEVDFFVDGSTSWEVKWMIINSHFQELDIEGGNDMRGKLYWAYVTGKFTGWDAGVGGHIVEPDGSTYFWQAT